MAFAVGGAARVARRAAQACRVASAPAVCCRRCAAGLVAEPVARAASAGGFTEVQGAHRPPSGRARLTVATAVRGRRRVAVPATAAAAVRAALDTDGERGAEGDVRPGTQVDHGAGVPGAAAADRGTPARPAASAQRPAARSVRTPAPLSDMRVALVVVVALAVAFGGAFALPAPCRVASSAPCRLVAHAALSFAHGLSLGSYELARIRRVPLTIAAGVVGRLVIMPLVAVGVLALGIPLEPAVATALILIAASPSGVVPLYVAALTGTSMPELAALATCASCVVSPLTLPLLVHALAPMPLAAASLLSLLLAYLAFATLPFIAGAATSMFVVRSAAAGARLRRRARPVAWLAVALLGCGAMSAARAMPPAAVGRGVFTAALLLSLLGALFGIVLGRYAGHGRRAQRALGYEYAMPGVAACAALGPVVGGSGGRAGVGASAGYACAAMLVAQALVVAVLTPYFRGRDRGAGAGGRHASRAL